MSPVSKSKAIKDATQGRKERSREDVDDQVEDLSEVRGENCDNSVLSFPFAHPDRLIPMRRLLKEVGYYKQEVQENEEKLATMTSSSAANPYDVKRFRQVLDESYMMVPDSTKRLDNALADLAKFLGEEDAQAIPKDNEWMKVANDLLQEHENPSLENEAPTTTNVDSLAEGEAF